MLIETHADVEENLLTLERYRTGHDGSLRQFYRDLLKFGVGFVVAGEGANYKAGPSRFVGYTANSESRHKSKSRNGGHSDIRLAKKLNAEWGQDPKEEELFLEHCAAQGITPANKKRRDIRLNPHSSAVVLPAKKTLLEDVAEIEARMDIGATEKQHLKAVRLGQGRFRAEVCRVWKNQCAVTGFQVKELLRASHIKPWCQCDDAERLDPYNGLLLTPNLDAAFDGGYISFDDDGRIMISPILAPAEATKLGLKSDFCISLHPKHRKYMLHHRENCFQI